MTSNSSYLSSELVLDVYLRLFRMCNTALTSISLGIYSGSTDIHKLCYISTFTVKVAP